MDMPRPPVPQPPVWVRAGLLLLLPFLAVGLWWDGQHYDPNLLEFKKSGSAGLTSPAELSGLPRLGEVRAYGKDNLYEYINGHAEFFISAGFSALMVAEYAPAGARQPALVADIFDMGQPLQAFGVLMDESGDGATPVNVGTMGFASGRGLQFIVGKFYVKLTAFDDATPLPPVAAQLAKALPVKAGDALAFALPNLGEITATRFIKENYRGIPGLGHVLERSVLREGKPLTLFLVQGTTAELDQVERGLAAFLDGEGMARKPKTVNGVQLMVVEDPYEGMWFHLREPERMLGVFAEPDDTLVNALKESGDGGKTKP